MRRVCFAVLILTALVVNAPPAASEEASGDVTTAALQLPPFDDGGACTGASDTLPGIFDFTEACAEHDACYAEGVDRLACDLAFREDLAAACVAQHPDAFDPRRYACLAFAEFYFLGVALFGGFFF
jgi:hypothetical protein